ncbi:hypothetical protein JCM6882_003225 [Rhodosporidiobolus microsporus]
MDRYITTDDLADGSGAVATVLAQAHQAGMPVPPPPRFDGATAFALQMRALVAQTGQSSELKGVYEAILAKWPLPAPLFPVEGIWARAFVEDEGLLRDALAAFSPPPTEQERELVRNRGYHPVGPLNARFYLHMSALPRLDVIAKAALRRSLLDALSVPTAFTFLHSIHVSSFPSIFFRQLTICLISGVMIDSLAEQHLAVTEVERGDLCRPLLLLEKLKDVTEAHQQHSKGGERDPFGLTPRQIQETFAEQVPGYQKMVDHLKTAWLAPTRPQSHGMGFVSPAAKDAVSWLYVKWRGSPEGKSSVGLHESAEKERWLLKRQREVQDTKNWAIWLVDPETRNRHPSQRPMKAALQHEVPYHLRPL